MNAARIFLAALFLVLPFEPRFTVAFGPLHLSLVEVIALPAFAAMAWKARRGDPRTFLSRPLLALTVFMVFVIVSAALADPEPARAFKFALRLGAMTTFAILIARQRDDDLKWGFRALALSGAIAAVLAILEGAGVRSLDVLLGSFREIPFNVAGVRRATAGSEYPNLGAAMTVYALLAMIALFEGRPRLRAFLVAGLTAGLAFTYSRGAWLAGFLGLLASAAFEKRRGRFVPAAIYALVLGAFVGREEISQIRFGSENANDFYAASYTTNDRFTLGSSERILVPVTVRNTGKRPWRKSEEIHLSYHLYLNPSRPLVDGPRTNLPRDVLPGEEVSFEAILRAPAKPGEYLLMWDLVHEDTTWFSGQGVKPGVAHLTVTGDGRAAPVASEAEAIKAIPDTLAWRPSRLELWRLAIRMWAAHPFFGVGPDNFRWTHGTLSGRPAFDTRVFSNNMFLEFAATLGAPALAAFCAALLFAFASGIERASSSSIARIAFSILVAMTVHGLADYVLAFTGHYLVFGCAIGVLSRPAVVIEPR